MKIKNKSAEFEKELISKLLLSPKDVPTALALLQPDELTSYRKAFEVVTDSFTNSKNLSSEFQDNNLKLSDFTKNYSVRPITAICRDVREVSNANKTYGILESALGKIPISNVWAFISDLQRNLIGSLKHFDDDRGDINQVITKFKELQVYYKERFKSGQEIIGLSTGYKNLDNAIDGLRPEHLWILGGYTNMGKTAASLNLTSSLVKQGKRVVYYSFEMSKVDVLSRLLGIMTDQGGLTIMKGFNHDEKKVAEALDQVENSDMAIHAFNPNLSEVLASMFEESLKKPVDMFVIDFIQLMTVVGAKSEYETVTTAILELQQAAKRFKTTILVLSQVSNDGARNNESPVMSFKGSGAIASAADLAIEIKSGEESISDLKRKLNNSEPVLMKWDVRKNRHGKVGCMDMIFTGRTGVFKICEAEEKAENDFDEIGK